MTSRFSSLVRRDGAATVALFLVAWIVRLWFHSGFVLGDDAEEFHLIRSLVADGISFEGHLRYRVPVWLFNYLSERLFGNYEASFFLPTWLLSSLLPVVACLTLRAAGYGLGAALFGGAVVALSPYEVLRGRGRANDLFVEFFLACALWAFVRWRRTPSVQAATVAVALWLAFYSKLWSVFLYPVVACHYLLRAWRHGDRRGLAPFTWVTLLLHVVTCAFWRLTVGTWVPFVTHLPGTYPVPANELGALFLTYPRQLFMGSEFGNSLFGLVPYVVVAGLVVKGMATAARALASRAPRIAMDPLDRWLLCSCIVFFALLNFFPNNFVFDRYYSVPRIFRYLAPLSYGLSLFAAKALLDLASLVPHRFALRLTAAFGALFVVSGGILEAVGPTRAHRARLGVIRHELRTNCPPAIVIEAWQATFFRELHLRDACPDANVRTAENVYQARDHERWLQQSQANLPRGAVLVTGLIQFVYYASHTDGFRLEGFDRTLDEHWVLIRELDPLPFDRTGEPIRLWRWTGEPSAAPRADDVPDLPPAQLFERGIQRFDSSDYPATRTWMLAILARFPDDELSDDAAYFAAVTHWREQDPRRTIREFQNLIVRFPDSSWVGAAYYHIGLAHRLLSEESMAKQAFEAAVRHAPPDSREIEYAQAALDVMHGPAPLGGLGRAGTEQLYTLQARVGALAFGIKGP